MVKVKGSWAGQGTEGGKDISPSIDYARTGFEQIYVAGGKIIALTRGPAYSVR
jgi:hypothetical protein